jgi:hypothetical protein
MLTITVDPQSFGLGFVFGTSIYVVTTGVAYVTFCAARDIISLARRSLR